MAYCFFDIDGTIAEDATLVHGIEEALFLLRKAGHKAFICSGRPYYYVEQLFHGLFDGYIAGNGRHITIQGNCVYHQVLTQHTMEQYAKEAREHGALLIFQGSQHRFILTEDEAQWQDWKDIVQLEQPMLWNQEDVYNFNLYYKEQETYDVLTVLWKDKIILNDHHNHASADATICDFDKGDGIKKVVSILNGSMLDTYAFGDGMNDIAMFRVCEHRIAMENAVEALKKQATYVSSHYQDGGVIDALHRYHLL